DAVYIERDGNAQEARPYRENCVGAIAVERHVGAVAEQMPGRYRSVCDGVEVFMPDGWKILQMHAAIHCRLTWLPAVDCGLMAAGDKASGELFRKGLESAVIRGNSARPEESNAHLRLGCFGAREHARHLFRRLFAHRCVLEPTRHVLVVYAAGGLNPA